MSDSRLLDFHVFVDGDPASCTQIWLQSLALTVSFGWSLLGTYPCLGAESSPVASTPEVVLITNGGFEEPGSAAPPLGWAMWGADKYKIPEHFVRDTSVAHSGQASLRIYHPKDTAGYIVTDPRFALRPKPGTAMEIRFFARSDRPCQARFGVIGYQSIAPFVDAESPLNTTVSVGVQWREFSFQITEGLDFFADSARYLLLAFHASADPALECTLWIDDVTVKEFAVPDEYRIINPKTIKVPPLNHGLTPGEQLELIIDPSRSGGRPCREACGVSFHRLAGFTSQPYNGEGKYQLVPELEQAIRELLLPVSRVYGVGHEPPQENLPPWPIETALDRLAELCRKTGIPMEWMVVELEEQSANRKLPGEIWARAVRYARDRRYPFRYWEVANEPYSPNFRSEKSIGPAFPTSDDYVAHVKAVSRAIHAVDPEAQVGVAIAVSRPRWGQYVLKAAAGNYDFVVAHYYGFDNAYKKSVEELVLTQNYRILKEINRQQILINAYNPGRQVYQLDTEWGMHSSGPNGERADNANRNANIIGVLHRAVRLIYYVRESPLKGASAWELLGFSRGLGFTLLPVDQPQNRTYLYWFHYQFIRHVGEELVTFSGRAPFYQAAADPEGEFSGPITPVLLTRSGSRNQVFAIIVNGSWQNEIPYRLAIKNAVVTAVNGLYMTDSDLDRLPLVRSPGEVVRTVSPRWQADPSSKMSVIDGKLPRASVLFLTITLAPRQ
jgi:hypothetical protein